MKRSVGILVVLLWARPRILSSATGQRSGRMRGPSSICRARRVGRCAWFETIPAFDDADVLLRV